MVVVTTADERAPTWTPTVGQGQATLTLKQHRRRQRAGKDAAAPEGGVEGLEEVR